MGGIVNAINRLVEAIKALRTTPTLPVFTNASRPAATAVPAGYLIFNSDDNFPNVSNGAVWKDMAGTTT
jgi:hypothetical protein